MKNTKFALIAFLATIITLGTAYAAWHFAEASATEDFGITLGEYVTDGTVTIDSVTQGSDSTNLIGSNITLHETGSNDNVLTITITHTADPLNPASIGFDGQYEILISTDLASYITISNSTGVISENDTTVITATISWIAGEEPTTVAEYTALQTALATPGHSITITASVTYSG